MYPRTAGIKKTAVSMRGGGCVREAETAQNTAHRYTRGEFFRQIIRFKAEIVIQEKNDEPMS